MDGFLRSWWLRGRRRIKIALPGLIGREGRILVRLMRIDVEAVVCHGGDAGVRRGGMRKGALRLGEAWTSLLELDQGKRDMGRVIQTTKEPRSYCFNINID